MRDLEHAKSSLAKAQEQWNARSLRTDLEVIAWGFLDTADRAVAPADGADDMGESLRDTMSFDEAHAFVSAKVREAEGIAE